MVEIRQTAEFANWLRGLKDRRASSRVLVRLKQLEQGHVGDASSVGKGISELRIHCGPGYRLYFTHRGNTVTVLLCGGSKATQNRDIKRARQLAKKLD